MLEYIQQKMCTVCFQFSHAAVLAATLSPFCQEKTPLHEG